MKKRFAIIMVLALALGLTACGSSQNTDSGDSSGADANSDSGTKYLYLVTGGTENDGLLEKLAEMYEAKTGVYVDIEFLEDGIDIQGTLQGYYKGDNMPDIFICNGAEDFANWEGMLADLSGQEWAADTDVAYVNEEGTLGFPVTAEAIGLVYNADILKKAGVDPANLTGPDEMAEAFAAIDAQKTKLGLTAVVGYCPGAVGPYGDSVFANYLDAGLDPTDTTYIDLLNKGGQLDSDRFADFASFVGLLNQYTDPELVTSGSYNQQVLNFASGQYAFVTQGSWIADTMTGQAADAYQAAGSFQVGILPYAFQSGIDTILTSSPSWWAVYQDGDVSAAKAFLQWLATDEAQKVLVMEAGCISPFRSCTYTADHPFAETMKEYISNGKTSAWHWMDQKEDLAEEYTGEIFQDYAEGKLETVSFIAAMKQACRYAYAD